MTAVATRPRRIQRRRTKGWRIPEGAVYVGRPSRWGNPFEFHRPNGLVRYRPANSAAWMYESRISADGMRHDYFGPDGKRTHFEVRYATRTELVELFRRTLLDPDPGMLGGYPSKRGHYAACTIDEIREQLVGRNLVCWCELDQPCHADVLLELANGAAA